MHTFSKFFTALPICLSASMLANASDLLKEAKISASVEKADIQSLIDGNEPASSTDFRINRLSFHPKRGSSEWLEYTFDAPKEIKNFGLYWFDEAIGAATHANKTKEILPKSWNLLYWKDGAWKKVPVAGGVERDMYNVIDLPEAVTTTKLKVEVLLHEGLSGAIVGCQINGEKQKAQVAFVDPDKELQRVKANAKSTLTADVDEFNGYSHLNGNRPEFDGWLVKENNEEFLQKNVPKFLCSNEDYTEVFNYRWWMITKHLKEWEEDGEEFYVFTEFPGIPGWAANSGAIPAPAGHQFYDLRWMRDPKYLQSYAEYWMAGPPSRKQQMQNNCWLGTLPRPQSHHYTSWMVDGSEALLKIHPDKAWRDKILPSMERHQDIWDMIFKVDAPGKLTNGLFKCLDMYDANEFTISTTLGLVASGGAYEAYNMEINKDGQYKGQEKWRNYFTDGQGWHLAFDEGVKNKNWVYPQAYDLDNYQTVPQAFGGNHDWYINEKGERATKGANSYPNCFTVRPSLNCYMFGNYRSLGTLYSQKAAESGDQAAKAKAEQYNQTAAQLQKQVTEVLWHTPSKSDDHVYYEQRGSIDDPFFYSRLSGDNLYTGGVVDDLSIIRESVGYTPWYFNMLPEADGKYDVAWKQFGDELGFKQPFGMSTAEYRHDFFNEMSYGWNGRGWPFQNSVVYKAYANYLRNYKQSRGSITDEDRQLLYHHMTQYVELHGRRRSIGEWYLPRTGGYRLPLGGDVVQSTPAMGKGMGDVQDYFHSTFPDMLIEDMIGFQSSHEKQFTLQPLLPEDKWDYFYLGDLKYHGHEVDILWKKDWDAKTPGDQSKLYVWVDGKQVASADDLNSALVVKLP